MIPQEVKLCAVVFREERRGVPFIEAGAMYNVVA